MAFNGHAHIYQRNTAPPGGSVSYVTGGGGAALAKIGGAGCAPTDAYGVGWNPASGTGNKKGPAPKPYPAKQAFPLLPVPVKSQPGTLYPTAPIGPTLSSHTPKF